MSNNPIGFSTGFFYHIGRELPLAEKLSRLSATGTQVLELNLTDLLDNNWQPSEEELKRIASFSYRSIHLPGSITYPSPEADDLIAKILPSIVEKVSPHAVVLHPDLIKDFAWTAKHLQPLAPLAIENMDWKKGFGSNAADLEQAFSLLPKATWVFDVNHAYTLDPTMELGNGLYERFSDRLTHYHASGFGGPDIIHACLCETKEDVIASAIMPDGKPVVLESIARMPQSTPQAELSYLSHLLAQ